MGEIEKEYCEITGKVCLSLKDARYKIRVAKTRTRSNKRKQIPQRYYWCKHCKKYHLTHYRNLHTAKVTLRRYGPKGDREF